MRAPNSIDFWRGLALIMIFIDHVPGIIFENYTYQHFAISDAAEVFVFLAGWSLRIVTSGSRRQQSVLRMTMRLESRAFTIYIAQVFVTAIALAITATGAILLQDSLLLEWNNAAVIFEAPLEAQLAVAIMSHQLSYFDILPLYVLLMAFAPAIVLLDRMSAWVLLGVSLAAYVSVLWTGFNIPTWPVEGRWFFNPFAWQLVFVLGFLCADPQGIARFVHRRARLIGWLVAPIILYCAWLSWERWAPDPLAVPEPPLFFMFDKSFASPARIGHLLCAVVFSTGLFAYVQRFARPFANFFAMLGRNSLQVFCAASIMSLAAQFTRYGLGDSFATDLLVLSFGTVVMGATAWLSEWSDRIA